MVCNNYMEGGCDLLGCTILASRRKFQKSIRGACKAWLGKIYFRSIPIEIPHAVKSLLNSVCRKAGVHAKGRLQMNYVHMQQKWCVQFLHSEIQFANNWRRARISNACAIEIINIARGAHIQISYAHVHNNVSVQLLHSENCMCPCLGALHAKLMVLLMVSAKRYDQSKIYKI